MPETIASLSSDRPAPSAVYRPVSILAIVSLAVAGIYSAVVFAISAFSIYLRTPLFLEPWTLLFPALAGALALTAGRQIRRAEGTRSGAALASWSGWLCILFGLGYLAFYIGTYLAVWMQAQDFTNKWIDKIRKGEVSSINSAFLDTQDPEQRRNERPDDQKLMRMRYGSGSAGRKGPLAQFQENEMVRMTAQGGAAMEVQYLGVKSWDFDQTTFKVQQKYRISTPEAKIEVLVGARSNDSSHGRSWSIIFDNNETRIEGRPAFTPLGMALMNGRKDSSLFVSAWLEKKAKGDIDWVYLRTCEPGEWKQIGHEYHLRMTAARVGTIAAVAGDPTLNLPLAHLALLGSEDLMRRRYLPGYLPFIEGGLVRTTEFYPPKNKEWETAMRADARKLFSPYPPLRINFPEGNAFFQPDKKTGRYRYYHDIELHSKIAAGNIPKYRCEARLVVENCAADWEQRPHWRVAGIELLSFHLVEQMP